MRADPGSSRYLALFCLTVVYAFNYLDRQIIGILAGPIKADMKLTDTQLGLMGGLAFAIFYSVLGVPIARIADRKPRHYLIGAAFALWSAMTAMCGAAANFWQLFLARLGVGVGEAGGAAPSYSLISDYFPPEHRARALAVFSLGIPIGSAAGLLIGGELAARYGWRTAFITLGLIGFVLAPLFILLVRDPGRGRFDGARADAQAPSASLRDVLRVIGPKKSFWLVGLGAATAAMLGYGLLFWLPSFLQRSHNFSLSQTGQFLSVVTIVGGSAGMLLGGWLGDHFSARNPARYATISCVAMVLILPVLFCAMEVKGPIAVFFSLLLAQALSLLWSPPSIAAIQLLAPASMRATASAIFLLMTNLIGLGIGAVVFGALADFLNAQYGPDALKYAILICSAVLCPLSAGLYYCATRTLKRDTPEQPASASESAL